MDDIRRFGTNVFPHASNLQLLQLHELTKTSILLRLFIDLLRKFSPEDKVLHTTA